jgi:hypothetical protein
MTFKKLRLMNFIRRIGRDEIYIKYVHQLVNVCTFHPLTLIKADSHPDASTITKLRGSGSHAQTAL